MRLDDGTAYRQAHSEAARLRTVEGLEYPLEICGFDAGPGILERNKYAVWSGCSCGMDEQVACSGVRAHGLNRVDDQVEHHLLQLDPIAPNQRQILCQFCLQRYAVGDECLLRHLDGFDDGGVDVEALPSWWCLLDQRTGALDDLTGAGAVPHDAAEQTPHRIHVGRLGAEQPQRGLRIHDDGAG